jgi:hypothetical protein
LRKLAALLLVIVVSSTALADDLTVKGAGMFTCAQFNSFKEDEKEYSVQWMLGYITAAHQVVVQAGASEFLDPVPYESIRNTLVTSCKSSPQSLVAQQANRIFNDLAVQAGVR